MIRNISMSNTGVRPISNMLTYLFVIDLIYLSSNRVDYTEKTLNTSNGQK